MNDFWKYVDSLIESNAMTLYEFFGLWNDVIVLSVFELELYDAFYGSFIVLPMKHITFIFDTSFF